jgi:hypothetical protein
MFIFILVLTHRATRSDDGLISVDSSSSTLATRCRRLFQRVLFNRKSPFDIKGSNAVFNMCLMDQNPSVLAPENVACWDTLWEACAVADSLFVSEYAASVSTEGSSIIFPSSGIGIGHVHSSSFQWPQCLLRPWTKITDEMNVDITAEQLLRLNSDVVKAISSSLRSTDLEDNYRLSTSPAFATAGKGVFSWICARFPIIDEETSPGAASCVALSPLEKYLISDSFRDIFHFFQPYIRDDGTHIGEVDEVLLHMLAVFKLFPAEADVHLEFIMIETLLLFLVQVPGINYVCIFLVICCII